MNSIPTGRVTKEADGSYDLILTRSFRAGIEDVWASVTDPERTAHWYGTWKGEAGPGKTIDVQMGFEEGAPWSAMTIDSCREPQHLALSAVDDYGAWHLEVNLTENDGVTDLEFIQHRIDPGMVESIGPGWEYYLDNLVASRDELPLPDFHDYYPSQSAYFVAQLEAVAGQSET